MRYNKRVYVALFLFFIGAHAGIASSIQMTAETRTATVDIDTTMWRFLSATDRSAWNVSKEDSAKAYRIHFSNGVKAFRNFATLYKKIETKRATISELAEELITHLTQARTEFEQGIKLDPFNSYLRTAIAAVYLQLDRLITDNTRRLPILFNRLCLETDPHKKADLYNKIGKIYLNLQAWEKARDNFQLAVTHIFEGRESEIDTAKLFDTIYYRGFAHLKLYEGEPALTSFRYARMIAPTEEQKQEIARWIDYINWDGGNIRASEQYQHALALTAEKKYDEVETVYLELTAILQTKKAKDEVEYRLSIIEFNYRDKKELAIQRLWNMLKTMPLDPATGVPEDAAHADYWEAYCKMCLYLATVNTLEDKKTAFIYFQKASQIENSERGKAFLNLAMMSLNNPDLCLSFCERALRYLDRLAESEKKTLYNIYYQAQQRKGNFDEALKWFKKYHEI